MRGGTIGIGHCTLLLNNQNLLQEIFEYVTRGRCHATEKMILIHGAFWPQQTVANNEHSWMEIEPF